MGYWKYGSGEVNKPFAWWLFYTTLKIVSKFIAIIAAPYIVYKGINFMIPTIWAMLLRLD